MLLDRRQIFLDAVVDADVEHLEAGALHHHADEVLADVVDVALDGADHHLAHLRRAGGDQQRAQDRHSRLHRVGGHQHFRHEQDAVAEIDADDAHALDQRLGQHVVGRPAAVQQDAHAVLDLLLQAVIEIVVHLRDEFVVRQRGKVEFVIRHGVCRHSCAQSLKIRTIRAKVLPSKHNYHALAPDFALRRLRGRRVVKFSRSVSADRWSVDVWRLQFLATGASFQPILQQIYGIEKCNKIKGKFCCKNLKMHSRFLMIHSVP